MCILCLCLRSTSVNVGNSAGDSERICHELSKNQLGPTASSLGASFAQDAQWSVTPESGASFQGLGM